MVYWSLHMFSGYELKHKIVCVIWLTVLFIIFQSDDHALEMSRSILPRLAGDEVINGEIGQYYRTLLTALRKLISSSHTLKREVDEHNNFSGSVKFSGMQITLRTLNNAVRSTEPGRTRV